ncbi:MAG: hypothetical protein ACFB14_11280 [Leptolyngbyaceae cyanobacterium]
MIITTYPNILSLPADALAKVRDMTDLVYHPLKRGYTHSYGIEGWPDLRLMEGVAAPPQSDKVAGYRLMLMLHNPGNNYIFRDVGQAMKPQGKGELVVLDIEAQHEVHSKAPNGGGGHEPWSALVWGPQGKPCMKENYELFEAIQIAQKECERFLKTL